MTPVDDLDLNLDLDYETVVDELEYETVVAPRNFADRTKPKYQTFGPGDGRDWHQYFYDLKAPYRSANEAIEPEVEQDEREVLIPGHDLAPEEIAALPSRGKPAQVHKRLADKGWDIRVRQSLVRVPAVLYLNDSEQDAEDPHQKGDVRYEEYELETTCLLATKRGPDGKVGLALEATWTSKDGFCLAQTADPILGREIRVGYMKARKPNGIEIEEGIEPPMGLKEWVDIVCPRPAAKKKRTVKEDLSVAEENVWAAA